MVIIHAKLTNRLGIQKENRSNVDDKLDNYSTMLSNQNKHMN